MTLHNVMLQHDVINTLGRAIEPLSLSDLVHQVMNEGYKGQRIYTDDEILDVLRLLVDTHFVTEKNGCYEWKE